MKCKIYSLCIKISHIFLLNAANQITCPRPLYILNTPEQSFQVIRINIMYCTLAIAMLSG